MTNDAQRRRNRRVRAVYFETEEQLAAVVEGARLGGVPFCVMLRNAAIREANRLRRLALRRRQARETRAGIAA
jgi:hypothetical protein